MARHLTRMTLKRCVLAVSVLIDLDLTPGEKGVVVEGVPPVLASWQECRQAIGDLDPESGQARTALARWLLRRRWLADHPYDDLSERARPVGLPVGHTLHPGPDWIRQRVLGDTLDLGLGFVGIQPKEPDRVIFVGQALLEAAGMDGGPWWPRARAYLERMGEQAAERWMRDRNAVVRPMGDCDVVTLLGSSTFRHAITSGAGGLRPVVVPMRTRGWLDVSRIDPAFGPAAAAATDPVERGFARPLLVTADEVTMVPAGGRPQVALDDPVRDESWLRPVLYR